MYSIYLPIVVFAVFIILVLIYIFKSKREIKPELTNEQKVIIDVCEKVIDNITKLSEIAIYEFSVGLYINETWIYIRETNIEICAYKINIPFEVYNTLRKKTVEKHHNLAKKEAYDKLGLPELKPEIIPEKELAKKEAQDTDILNIGDLFFENLKEFKVELNKLQNLK